MKKHLKPISALKHRRTHGFRQRMATRGGRLVLQRRRRKGRHALIP